METVFDYNITDSEKLDIGVLQEKEVYLKDLDADTANMDLAFLFSNRKDLEKAESYADKLEPERKIDCLRTIHHP